MSKAKGEAQQDGRKGKNTESNPIPTRDAWKAQTKSCVHQDPETLKRLSQTCLFVLSVSCGCMGQQWPAWGPGLWLQKTWEALHVAEVLLEEIAITPP